MLFVVFYILISLHIFFRSFLCNLEVLLTVKGRSEVVSIFYFQLKISNLSPTTFVSEHSTPHIGLFDTNLNLIKRSNTNRNQKKKGNSCKDN